jgi:hypothetical protein
VLRRLLKAAVVVVVVVVGLALLAVAFLTLPAIGSVSRQALAYSVTRHAGGSLLAGGRTCRRVPGGYRCLIPDSQGSGAATYRVRLSGRRCWRAQKVSAEQEGPLPRRLSACAGLRDQARLVDRLL